MRKINIEELEIGDEIIIGSGPKLKYLKVLKKPVFRGNTAWKDEIDPITLIRKWNQTAPKYSTVRCSISQIKVHFKYASGIDRSYNKYEFEMDCSKHNHKINIDLNCRDIFLVKREQEPVKEKLWQNQ